MDMPASRRPHETASTPIRTCVTCRRRRVKCDRMQPCSNCLRAGADCQYPAGRGRAPKKPRPAAVLDAQVAERLSRLENLLRSLGGCTDRDAPGQARGGTAMSSPRPSTESSVSMQDPNAIVDGREFGRLMIDETRSYYTSNMMWASLANEIDELRDALLESASEDEDSEAPEESSSAPFHTTHVAPLDSTGAMFGFRSLAHSLRTFHPSLPQAVALFDIFTKNVAPLVRIFHMPSLHQMYWDAVASLDDKNIEALLFSMYYSSIISIGPEQCASILGLSREDALGRYRFAVEQALARAGLLTTQSIVLLQAAVLFLTALRNQDSSRNTWSLTALVFHLAQTMGLHRDGSIFGLKPFETELRRRLWWHICILDSRSSEYHGCEPIVHESAFDTRVPLHINDSDLFPGMVQPPAERDEATDMTLCMIRCEALKTGWKISLARPRLPKRPGEAAGGSALSLQDRQTLVEELEKKLQTKYLRHCEESGPRFMIASLVARLIVARFTLMVYYPANIIWSGVDSSAGQDSLGPPVHLSMRDRLFTTSTEALELCGILLTSKDISHWTWYSKTHIQWHAVAFVLSELCSRPPSDECDRAWNSVTSVVHGVWMKDNDRKDALWRPIRRLLAKARYVREMQQTAPKARQRHQGTFTGLLSASLSSRGSAVQHASDSWSPSVVSYSASTVNSSDLGGDLGSNLQGLPAGSPFRITGDFPNEVGGNDGLSVLAPEAPSHQGMWWDDDWEVSWNGVAIESRTP